MVFSSQVKTPSIVVYETCFDDEMAHATPQVKQHLKSYLDELEVIDSSNYSNAFIKAFDLLESVQDTEDRGIIQEMLFIIYCQIQLTQCKSIN